jgi:hypothetical protein
MQPGCPPLGSSLRELNSLEHSLIIRVYFTSKLKSSDNEATSRSGALETGNMSGKLLSVVLFRHLMHMHFNDFLDTRNLIVVLHSDSYLTESDEISGSINMRHINL